MGCSASVRTAVKYKEIDNTLDNQRAGREDANVLKKTLKDGRSSEVDELQFSSAALRFVAEKPALDGALSLAAHHAPEMTPKVTAGTSRNSAGFDSEEDLDGPWDKEDLSYLVLQ